MIAVNCGVGETIAAALNQTPGRPLTINVTGPCTENVVITRDDVTLQGVVPNTLITAANSTQSTILLNGARRITLNQLDVRGGTTGILGFRGSDFDLKNCTVRNNTIRGVTASSNSEGAIDACTLELNGDGALAANGSNLYITNSTIRNNTSDGVIAVRNSHVRLGQDILGTTVVKPVTITGNASNGLVITENSVGIVVGGTVERVAPGDPIPASTATLVFVGRASRASIGVGSNNLTAATIVRNSAGDGIHVADSANALIVNTTVTNTFNGIVVRNGASARIGIDEANTALNGNTITANRRIGIQISDGGTADIGGTTISNNGTEGVGNRFGLAVFGARALLAGGNTIENNPFSGIIATRGSSIIVGAGFGAIPIANTIRGNGALGLAASRTGGIALIDAAVADVRGATIDGNHGTGVSLFGNSYLTLNNTVVTDTASLVPGNVNAFHGGQGIIASLRSTIEFAGGNSTISNNDGNGVAIAAGSTANFRGDTVTGNAGFGLQCFDGESSFAGNTTNIGANTGGVINPACTGF